MSRSLPHMMRRSKRKSTSVYAGKQTTGKTRREDTTKSQDANPARTNGTPTQVVPTVQEQNPTTNDVTMLYSREGANSAPPMQPPRVCTTLTASPAGITEHTLPTCPTQSSLGLNINPVPSIYSSLGAHVSATTKNKIINGEYVDLAQLLENTSKSDKQEKQIVLLDGVLLTKEKTKQNIVNIEKWTDAFLVFASIYTAAHPSKYQGMLKYINIIRLGASRLRGMGWKSYDEQFRFKMSMDPSKSWDSVDQELWLLFMVDSNAIVNPMQHTPFSTNSTFNKCYNFNYKGNCDRFPCNYKHACFRCSGSHPFFACTVAQAPGFGNLLNQTFRPRSQLRLQNPGLQNPVRQRAPFHFRPQGEAGSRYMGPRQVAYQGR